MIFAPIDDKTQKCYLNQKSWMLKFITQKADMTDLTQEITENIMMRQTTSAGAACIS